MTDGNVKEYLEAQLKAKMEGLNGAAEMLVSMVKGSKSEGKADPIDLQASLSCYRGLVEVSTLVKAYNENFYDDNTRELQRQIDPTLEATERALSETVSELVKKVNIGNFSKEFFSAI